MSGIRFASLCWFLNFWFSLNRARFWFNPKSCNLGCLPRKFWPLFSSLSLNFQGCLIIEFSRFSLMLCCRFVICFFRDNECYLITTKDTCQYLFSTFSVFFLFASIWYAANSFGKKRTTLTHCSKLSLPIIMYCFRAFKTTHWLTSLQTLSSQEILLVKPSTY